MGCLTDSTDTTKTLHLESRVIWITGLSGAGKTTLAKLLVERFREASMPVILLDGDELREVFGAADVNAANHGEQARMALASQYARLSRIIAMQGVTVVVATISLFRDVHTWNRDNLPGYFEVFLKVPLEELRSRDAKDIYRRYDLGEISNVAGLDLPVDEPENPDMTILFESSRSLACIVDELYNKLTKER